MMQSETRHWMVLGLLVRHSHAVLCYACPLSLSLTKKLAPVYYPKVCIDTSACPVPPPPNKKHPSQMIHVKQIFGHATETHSSNCTFLAHVLVLKAVCGCGVFTLHVVGCQTGKQAGLSSQIGRT